MSAQTPPPHSSPFLNDGKGARNLHASAEEGEEEWGMGNVRFPPSVYANLRKLIMTRGWGVPVAVPF